MFSCSRVVKNNACQSSLHEVTPTIVANISGAQDRIKAYSDIKTLPSQ
jgi:hypothetical protein